MRMKLSNSVRDHRVLARMTQEELAAAVEVSRQTVIAIEKGDYTPSALLAMRIARVFGKAVEDMFSIVDD
jgi:putative transcriptional regulator